MISKITPYLIYSLILGASFVLGQAEPEIVKPIGVGNPTPGRPNHSEKHYVLESDQSRGRLELEFEHPRFGSGGQGISHLLLVMKVPGVAYANTSSTISVWKGKQQLASRKGASRGLIMRFKLAAKHFADEKNVILTVKCGSDAVKISEDPGQIFLEIHSGSPPEPPAPAKSNTSTFASSKSPSKHVGKVVNLVEQSSQVLSLLVVPLGDSQYAGLSSKLSISALPASGGNFASLEFNQDVGDSMRGALAEVVRFHRLKHNGWPKDYQMELAFAEKYSPKDGPSAAVATALLIESIFSGKTLDKRFAVTGDMNAAGDVQPIGGVAAKLRGAKSGGAEIVAIPIKNRRRALDLAMLDGIKPLMGLQVFTIETFDEALALASEKKPEKVKKAITLFAEIQSSKLSLTHPQTLQKLRQILVLAPNHLSAKIVLMKAQNQFPSSLSIVASLEEVDKVLGSIPESAKADLNSKKSQLSNLGDARSKLLRLRSIIDPRVRGFADAWIEWTGMADQYFTGRVSSKSAANDLKKAYEKAKAERLKIISDKSVQEELIQ